MQCIPTFWQYICQNIRVKMSIVFRKEASIICCYIISQLPSNMVSTVICTGHPFYCLAQGRKRNEEAFSVSFQDVQRNLPILNVGLLDLLHAAGPDVSEVLKSIFQSTRREEKTHCTWLMTEQGFFGHPDF